MSFSGVYTLTLTCDDPDHPKAEPVVVTSTGLFRALAVARSNGWTVYGTQRKAFCPEHKPKGYRPGRFSERYEETRDALDAESARPPYWGPGRLSKKPPKKPPKNLPKNLPKNDDRRDN